MIMGGIALMSNLFILNTLIVTGIIAAAIMAVTLDRLLPSIIALGIAGLFMTLEFIILQAPDVAIAEAAVGGVLVPLMFVATLKKIKGDKKV